MSQHLERAQILRDLKRPTLAEQEARRELTARPEDAEAHLALAQSLLDQERFADAQEEIEEAIRLQPDSDYACRLLAIALLEQACRQPRRFRRALFQRAEQAIREAIRLYPQDPAHFFCLANVFNQQDRWSECAEAAREGLRVEPEDQFCAYLLANALIELNRTEEAREIVSAMMAKHPNDAGTHINRGLLCLIEDNPAQALQHFREVVRIDPQTAEVHKYVKDKYAAYRNKKARRSLWLLVAFCLLLVILSMLKRF